MTYGKPGNGAYMISNKGVSFSSHDQQVNNKINNFKTFTKGDTIVLKFSPIDMTLKFSKNKDSYELQIDPKLKSDIYPCVLFYFPNDTVEISTY